jgi:isoquinoline 1-oxidoreductase subunit alpha
MMNLQINGHKNTVDVEPEMPLLWVLRDEMGLTGTKYGCGVAQCGACTVLIDGAPMRSCSLPVAAAAGKNITTIEGLSPDSSHPVQLAWKALDVPQCGYCQSGQILAAAALLKRKPKPTDQDIDEAMTNICRCGSYRRIRAGIHHAAQTGQGIPSVIHMSHAEGLEGAALAALCAVNANMDPKASQSSQDTQDSHLANAHPDACAASGCSHSLNGKA